jgi:hypothetical protein
MLTGGVQGVCVGCGKSGSPPNAGGERYASLLSEGAVEWTRLGVEALVLELFVNFLEPLTCICLLSFEYHQSCMEGFRKLKCTLKCVECRDSVGCECDGHWWVLQVLLLGGAEFEWALPHWCNVPGVNAFVALYCFFDCCSRELLLL